MRRTIRWPDNKLLACTFTVALEAFRKSGRFKKTAKLPVNLCSISHANYGGNADIWRILEIIERNHVRAVVFVNGLAAQKWPDAVRALHAAGHEIAGHAISNDVEMVDLTGSLRAWPDDQSINEEHLDLRSESVDTDGQDNALNFGDIDGSGVADIERRMGSRHPRKTSLEQKAAQELVLSRQGWEKCRGGCGLRISHQFQRP